VNRAVPMSENNRAAREFTRYAAAGAIGTAAQYLTLGALVRIAGANAVLASTLGMIAGAFINYVLNYRYTFGSSQRHRESMPRFFFVAAISLAINGAAMTVLTAVVGWHYLPSQIIATGLVLVSGFVANRVWTFREKADEHRH
jgi:putative flippase GtrA